MHVLPCIIFALILLDLCSGRGDPPKSARQELVFNRTQEWRNLSTFFFESYHKRNDPHSRRNVEAKLYSASGVYSDRSSSIHRHHPTLEDTVLMTVIEYDDVASARFKNMFLNWVCYIKEHNLKVLVYYLGKVCLGNGSDSSVSVLKREANYEHLYFVPYPYALFWHAMSFKQGGSSNDMYLVSPSVECPNFKVFGSVLTVVAKFEAVQHGYSVLYLDVDLVFVRDPIPYMLQGTADINFGIESRDCAYSSRTPPGYNHWKKTEPNTGVAYIRNSPNSRFFIRRWIRFIIDGSHRNDQLAIMNLLVNEIDDISCNSKANVRDDSIEIPVHNSTNNNNHSSTSPRGGLSHYNQYKKNHNLRQHRDHDTTLQQSGSGGGGGGHNVRQQHASSNRHFSEKRVYETGAHKEFDHLARNLTVENSKKIKFCFLNEFLFPNGMIGLHCSGGKKGGNMHDFMMGMAQMGSLWYHNNTEIKSPVILHSNYVGNKERSLEDRGFWLQRGPDMNFNLSSCKRFDLDKIIFTQPEYLNLFQEAKSLFNSSILQLVNGSVFRFDNDKTWTFHVYLNGIRRQIENKQLYFKLGLNDSIVSSVTDYVLYAIPKGPGIFEEADMRRALHKYDMRHKLQT